MSKASNWEQREGSSETSKHHAENGVPPGRLRERSRIAEKGRNSSGSPPRMEAIDKIAKGVERDVLAQSHRHRKQTRPLRPPSACFVIDEPEDRAIHEMEC